MKCPCQSGKDHADCCEPLISGQLAAESAEELMRSRYTAYTLKNIDYIEKTHDPQTRHEFDRESSEEWAEQTQWVGLEILGTEDGGREDQSGLVEFQAQYDTGHGVQIHHELSEFNKREGRWYFSDSKNPQQTVTRDAAKIGRNDPCPCGSGKKYKKCCG